MDLAALPTSRETCRAQGSSSRVHQLNQQLTETFILSGRDADEVWSSVLVQALATYTTSEYIII